MSGIPSMYRKFLHLFLMAATLGVVGTTNGQQLSASVTKTDITPKDSQWLLGYGPRKSTGINDSIFHRIILLNDGRETFCLISSDICLVSPAEYDRVAQEIQNRFGIPMLNIWWTVTHTHSAPEVGPPGLPEAFMGDRYTHEWDREYTRMVTDKMLEAVEDGLKNLEPAQMGWGWGFSQANINRRAIDENGKASLGLNPDGPVDRKIGLIRIDKANGDPLALVANYPIHGTVLGQEHTNISGDAPGIVAEYVEEKIGVPMLFINGAAGNIAPIYSVYPNPAAGHLSQFKVLLGDKILDAYRKIQSLTSDIDLQTATLTVTTPRKDELGWPDDLGAYTQNDAQGKPQILLPIRFLKINQSLALWSAPLELFCELSNEVRQDSPFPYTFYYGYSNGWLGYLPTAAAYAHGGYEVERVNAFTPRAGDDLVSAVSSFLMGWLSE
ncbi:neutral/alkaline non-lysosomal ceramidase N-terminal domain-containing protein [Cyclobacterium salsum]|uniref:neutral/alkaline non-lysosomal ceramidase N-terminal domain-containing protein n=1 Tax=Cyclobacterium salsum TaxID=2666329 RepID=UPI001390D10A|nr:neutral/alkaline non-lysosomal ceramidase N-terminal domain-containing protein [Cyclobacterium salsum]